ncbi:hypothetical protein MVI01_14330 [Myxococcus virescens]|uniref:Uncharacterized protein n=1 Tax=Myxococcus virescens TaxID=83456 RepID=A0A511HAB5_9BACT|nr:hypothetical protein MVI01_14330 [Myxococcus virescens]
MELAGGNIQREPGALPVVQRGELGEEVVQPRTDGVQGTVHGGAEGNRKRAARKGDARVECRRMTSAVDTGLGGGVPEHVAHGAGSYAEAVRPVGEVAA